MKLKATNKRMACTDHYYKQPNGARIRRGAMIDETYTKAVEWLYQNVPFVFWYGRHTEDLHKFKAGAKGVVKGVCFVCYNMTEEEARQTAEEHFPYANIIETHQDNVCASVWYIRTYTFNGFD